jgi:hypothetical protein
MSQELTHLSRRLLGITALMILAAALGTPGCEQPKKAEPNDVTTPQPGTKPAGSSSPPIAAGRADDVATAISGGVLPPGYRDWRLISVAREEGELDDIRAILGNDMAIKAYREGTRPFPDGTVIARIAWGYVPSEENNKVFGRAQSFVAGPPKNGVQFMVKDSIKYASTGGWGYSQFDDGKPAKPAALTSCFPCHDRFKAHDSVFTNYAP